ncbi:hypothetical protein BBJ28_00011348 [Nothophytophthora sp. Chile5]|nr:hypothetical protein BBJ28_00011348 [Nothophytophthora sp. Chile5]
MQPHRSNNNHKSRTVSEAPPSQDDPLPLAKTQSTAATGKMTRSKKITRKSMKAQQRTGKPIRRKSPGTVVENEFKKGKGYCSVVCRLESICSGYLCDEIKRTAHAIKQIQLEAWHLVSLRTLRCLENGLSLPDYSDKTFFDHCCSGVASTGQTHLIAQKNPELWCTIQIYQSQRERAGLAEVAHQIGYGDLKAALREQMVVNAGVMIREHFRKRLRLYAQTTFGAGRDDTLTQR